MAISNNKRVQIINNHFNASEALIQRVTPRWMDYYKQYRAYYDTKKRKYPYRSKLFIPYSFTSVEGVLAKLMEILFVETPIVKPIPREKNDIQSADMVEKLLDYQLYMMRIYPKAQLILRDALIYGTSYAKLFWRTDIRTLKVGEILTPGGERQEVTQNYALFDGPDIIGIPNERVFPDPNNSWENGTFIIHQEYKTMDWLKQQKKAGVGYLHLNEIIPHKYIPDTQMQMLRKQVSGASAAEPIEDRDIVEIWEYWDILNNKIYTVANRKVLIKQDYNTVCPGMHPFICVRPIALTGEIFGIGFMEMLHHLQMELNDVRNQRMDNVNLIINRIIKVGKHAGTNLNFLKSIPGAIWLAERPELISFEAPPDVTKSAYIEENIIKGDMQHTIGDYNYFRGASPETGRETATTVIRLQEAAMNRISGLARYIDETMIVPMAQIIMSLNKQNLSTDKVVRILGEKGYGWETVKNTDINKFYDFQAMGTIRASYRRRQDKEKALQLLQLILPLADRLNLDVATFMTDVLGQMGFDNAGKYILPAVSPQLIEYGARRLGGPPTEGGQPGRPVPPSPVAPRK